MKKKLILTLTEHRKFGVIIIPYIITPTSGNSFYSSIEKINDANMLENTKLCEKYGEIIKLIEEYSDTYIAKLFTKKKEDATEFLKTVDKEFIQNRIRPHIEIRLHKILSILPSLGIELYYKDRKYNKIYHSDLIKISDKKANAIFHFNRNDDGIQYTLAISNGNREISLKNKKAMVITQDPCCLMLDQMLFQFTDIDSKKLTPFFSKDTISIAKKFEKAYFDKFILNIIKHYKVKASGFTITEKRNCCKGILHLQNDLQGNPALLLKLKYNQKIILPNNVSSTFISLETKNDEYTFIKICRDFSEEDKLVKSLTKLGLSSTDNIHFNAITGTKGEEFYHTINWINTNLNKINNLGFEVKQNYFDKKYLINKIAINLEVNNEKDWFDIKGNVEMGDFSIPFLNLRKYILKNIREYILPDGTIAILPLEWFTRYKEIFLFADKSSESVRLSKMHFNLLNSKHIGLNNTYSKRIKDFFSTEINENTIELPKINATLRPYQAIGFKWMEQLNKNNFGGCLADDMGLGKTLQTITLLLKNSTKEIEYKIKKKQQTIAPLDLFSSVDIDVESQMGTPTSLIVMPSSLIHNWWNEIKKFAPNLNVFKHTGINRTKNIWHFKTYDIILTTYGVIRNDYEFLKQFPFHYIILDESQVIKNPESKSYKSIIQINGTHKLVLTGTPIENSLTDLWSQMNFINNGLLGNFSFFKKEFVSPIERYNDKVKSKKLKHLIHPFILRRTKEQVAKDLPPLTEQITICDMSKEQREIYEKEKSAIRNSIIENIEKQGAEKSAILILAAITKLRQLANHPKLNNVSGESGKFKEVTRILQSLIAENNKVLIFSSFVEHLKIYEEYLEENKLKYSLLTGQTKDRQKAIADFQNNEDNKVFLISLKAGGVGLNLTAADYVFILDPWWNPASENQAISRAHRIGQDKKVFVYRFISSESIEEKIMQLQEKKSELSSLFINTNNPFKTLSAEKIKELFK